MDERIKTLDISTSPDILRLAEEVDASQAPLMLTDGDRVVALLTPVATPAERQPPQLGQARRRRDSLLNIIGIGESGEPSDVEHHELEYLAEAYDTRDR